MGQKIWITSDTHFNHANIINYCARPFKDVEEMNATLISKWNNSVGKEDIVWHLGDFAMGGAKEVEVLRAQLNGKIYLIRGNHDTKPNDWYRERGFDRVYDKPIVVDKDVILSHEPIDVNYGHMMNFYGHVHNSTEYPTITGSGACVCIERWEYLPLQFDRLKKNVLGMRGVVE